MKKSISEKYKRTKIKMQPCCDMFIPFGFHTHFLFIPLWYTVMCISCRRKARGLTLEKAIKKYNAKLTQQND